MSKPLNLSLPGKSLRFLLACPIALFLAQLPQGLLALLQTAIEHFMENRPIIGFAVIFPVFCITSAISSALTFSLLLQHTDGKKPNLLTAASIVKSKFNTLLLGSLAVGVFFVLGLCALILPALYFMAVYLFVPHLILLNDKRPISAFLFQSKKWVTSSRTTLIQTMALILFMIALGIGSYLAGQKLTEYIISLSSIGGGSGMIALCVDMASSMLGGAILDVFVGYSFLNLKEQVEKKVIYETNLRTT